MNLIISIRRCIAITLLCAMLLACNKTNRYYEQLVASPELATESAAMYKTFYTVGDTIRIYGRLKGSLQVKIGDAPSIQVESQPAVVVLASLSKISYDCIKIEITKEMGIGINRPVSISGGGITLNCPAIEIDKAVRTVVSDSLKIVSYASLSSSAVIFYCRDGKGSIYLYDNSSLQLLRNGQTQTILSKFSDQQGSFTVTRMFSGGVDRKGKSLYFSALTEDNQSDNAANWVFRLCRMDMESKLITTVNRTLIPKDAKLLSEATYLPWEGDINDVKIIAARDIAPAEDGNVYMTLQCAIGLGSGTTVMPVSRTNFYVLAHMDPTGKLTYLYRSATEWGYSPWKNIAGTEYTTAITSFPGIQFSPSLMEMSGIQSISPDEKLFYVIPVNMGSEGVNLYDLQNRLLLYEYRKERMPTGEIPQFVGPFSALKNGWYFNFSYNPQDGWGLMPLPGERVLLLFFQGMSSKLYSTPAWSTLDFAKGRGDLYAPSYCELGNYRMWANDVLLNYDEAGHLYMTANSRKEFVKTVPR